MQTILPIVLVGLLAGAVIGFAAVGLFHRHHAAAMARRAHELSMHFSAEDTFDVPRRCAAFALCSAGHSPQATNLTYGRVRGVPLRAFDFRYEVGHGTRRSTRHYCVLLLEVPCPPAVLMWNRQDGFELPPAAQQPEGREGAWSWRGDAAQARRLAAACADLAASGVDIEAREEGLMLSFPSRGRWPNYGPWLEAAPRLIEALGLVPAPAEIAPPQNVANRPAPC